MLEVSKPIAVISALVSSLIIANPVQAKTEKLMAEHMAVMDLVQTKDATHQVQQSGAWSDPNTWGGVQLMPTDNARVYVPAGITVNVDSVVEAALMSVRVDGKLAFSPSNNSQLIFDTLVVTAQGELQVGSAEQPIAKNISAKLIVHDGNNGFETQDINSPDYDPIKLGQGIVAFGKVVMHGRIKTPYAALPKVEAGQQVLSFSDGIPKGWAKGDTLVLPGVTRNGLGDEVVTIKRIKRAKKEVLLTTPTRFEHIPVSHNKPGLALVIHVANLSRNIEISTSKEHRETFAEHQVTKTRKNSLPTTELIGRGHIMFMHSNQADMNYVSLTHMGRTNKLMAVDDSYVMDDGSFHVGTNPRARYPVHFHRAGHDSSPAKIKGCAVSYSPGWGFVNHSSYAQITDNVAYDVKGAAFVSEAGDEVGAFRRNLAIKTHGTATPDIDFQKTVRASISNDLGREGDGFWIESKTLTVSDNIATGFMGTGFTFWGNFLDGADSNLLDVKHTREPELAAADVVQLRADEVKGMLAQDNNQAYGGVKAMHTGHLNQQANINNFLAHGVLYGDSRWYASGKFFSGLTLIGDLENPQGIGVEGHSNSANIQFENVHIEGFEQGLIFSPRHGTTFVNHGYFNNVTDITFRKRYNYGHQATVIGDVVFGELTDNALQGRVQQRFVGKGEIHGPAGEGVVPLLPSVMSVAINGMENPLALYLVDEQHPSFVPYPNTITDEKVLAKIDPTWLGKSNRELEEIIGTSVNGGKAPKEATPLVNGVNLVALAQDSNLVNFEPMIKPTPNQLFEVNGAARVFDLRQIFNDREGDQFDYKIKLDNSSVISATITGNQLTIEPKAFASGKVRVEIKASASGLKSWKYSDRFDVTVQ